MSTTGSYPEPDNTISSFYSQIPPQSEKSFTHELLTLLLLTSTSLLIWNYSGSRDGSWYSDWLQAGQLRGQSSIPSRSKIFLHVHTSSGAHPAYNPMGLFVPGVKVAKV
jgi:hypothetical protein